jgi:signal transduction histidine kinase
MPSSLLTPSSHRDWNADDQAQFSAICEHLGRRPSSNTQGASSRLELERLRSYSNSMQSKLDTVEADRDDLQSNLEAARREAVREKERASNLGSFGLRSLRKPLLRPPGWLLNMNSPVYSLPAREMLPLKSITLKKELRLALQEIAHLKKDLSAADHKILELQGQALGVNQAAQETGFMPAAPQSASMEGSPVHGEDRFQEIAEGKKSSELAATHLPPESLEGIASISQELRQPMASIVGYTDILLGESVGILGALQRKFLERVKISTERMNVLIDDLVQISNRRNGAPSSNKAVDLNSVIDEAMAVTLGQMREKNVILRVDIPQQIPPILADRDALQQIIVHLLQNASSATPEEGEIHFACPNPGKERQE